MSAALKEPKETKTLDDKILLLVERDIPHIQKDMGNIRDTSEKQQSDIHILKTDIQVVKTKFEDFSSRWDTAVSVAEKQKECIDDMSTDIVAVKTSLNVLTEKLDNKNQKWYNRFESVLIVVLLLSVLALSGVKAYAEILKALVPITPIAEGEL